MKCCLSKIFKNKSKIEEIEAGSLTCCSLTCYIDTIKCIYKHIEKCHKPPSTIEGLFYRGETGNHELLPTVLRKEDNKRYDEKKEKKIFLNYRDNLPRMTSRNLDIVKDRLEILVEMQHYGIPTRLLDWSLSPLTALYFAVKEKDSKENSVVWVFNPWEYTKRLNLEGKLNMAGFEQHKLGRALLSSYGPTDIWNILNNIFYGRGVPERDEDLIFPLPVISKYQNDRMIHQSSAFTIHGSDKNKPLEGFVGDGELIKITIPSKNRRDILNDLRLLFINEYTIFPDFQGMAEEFKRNGGLYIVKDEEDKN